MRAVPLLMLHAVNKFVSKRFFFSCKAIQHARMLPLAPPKELGWRKDGRRTAHPLPEPCSLPSAPKPQRLFLFSAVAVLCLLVLINCRSVELTVVCNAHAAWMPVVEMVTGLAGCGLAGLHDRFLFLSFAFFVLAVRAAKLFISS